MNLPLSLNECKGDMSALRIGKGQIRRDAKMRGFSLQYRGRI